MSGLNISAIAFPVAALSAPLPLSLSSTADELYSVEYDWIKQQWEALFLTLSQENADQEKGKLLQNFLKNCHAHFMRNPSVYFNIYNTPIYEFIINIATVICRFENNDSPTDTDLYQKMFEAPTLPYDPVAYEIYNIEYKWVEEQWENRLSTRPPKRPSLQDFLNIYSQRMAYTRFGYFGDPENAISQFIKKVATQVCVDEGIKHPSDEQLLQKIFHSLGTVTVYEPHPGYSQPFQHQYSILSTGALGHKQLKIISLSDIVALISDPKMGLFYYAYLFHGLHDLNLLPEDIQQALARKEMPFLGSLLPEDRVQIKTILSHNPEMSSFLNDLEAYYLWKVGKSSPKQQLEILAAKLHDGSAYSKNANTRGTEENAAPIANEGINSFLAYLKALPKDNQDPQNPNKIEQAILSCKGYSDQEGKSVSLKEVIDRFQDPTKHKPSLETCVGNISIIVQSLIDDPANQSVIEPTFESKSELSAPIYAETATIPVFDKTLPYSQASILDYLSQVKDLDTLINLINSYEKSNRDKKVNPALLEHFFKLFRQSAVASKNTTKFLFNKLFHIDGPSTRFNHWHQAILMRIPLKCEYLHSPEAVKFALKIYPATEFIKKEIFDLLITQFHSNYNKNAYLENTARLLEKLYIDKKDAEIVSISPVASLFPNKIRSYIAFHKKLLGTFSIHSIVSPLEKVNKQKVLKAFYGALVTQPDFLEPLLYQKVLSEEEIDYLKNDIRFLNQILKSLSLDNIQRMDVRIIPRVTDLQMLTVLLNELPLDKQTHILNEIFKDTYLTGSEYAALCNKFSNEHLIRCILQSVISNSNNYAINEYINFFKCLNPDSMKIVVTVIQLTEENRKQIGSQLESNLLKDFVLSHQRYSSPFTIGGFAQQIIQGPLEELFPAIVGYPALLLANYTRHVSHSMNKMHTSIVEKRSLLTPPPASRHSPS